MPVQNTEETTPKTPPKPNLIKLGKKLENPYSIENMKIALDSLATYTYYASTVDSKVPAIKKEDIKIEPTDYYVRFLPKDEDEFKLIRRDTTLHLYSYPLDYEITEQGNRYHDPSLADDQITWQYTVVKPNYEFPSVKYELLSKLFIPEHSPYYKEIDSNESSNSNTWNSNISAQSESNKTQKILSTALEGLETVSLHLTNNLPEKDKKIVAQSQRTIQNIKSGKISHNYITAARKVQSCWWFFGYHCSTKYRPHGNIRIQTRKTRADGSYYNSTLEGARVEARWWFSTESGITDSNGNFVCGGTFRYSFRYHIKWDRYEFEVKDAWGYLSGVAEYPGPTTRGGWDLTIRDYEKEQIYYGTIFRAAYHYYYKYIKGLRRPKKNCWYCNKLSIKAEKNGLLSSYHLDKSKFTGAAEVNINAFNKEIDKIYATTIHELAHAAHSEHFSDRYDFLVRQSYLVLGNSDYKRSARCLLESWATGVEIILTRMVYPDYYKHNNFLIYMGPTQGTPFYTEIVVQLIEEGGLTLKQIEDTLGDWRAVQMDRWKNAIIEKYGDAEEIRRIFKYYWY